VEQFRTIIEPFRIHSVEPIRMTTREERCRHLEQAGHNLFRSTPPTSRSTCSPTRGPARCRPSSGPGIQRGDESYAGSPVVHRFEARSASCSRSATSSRPTRAAPRSGSSSASSAGEGKTVPNNSHFDTTRANVEWSGAQALDLPIPEARQPATEHPFKGNLDVDALDALLVQQGHAVPVVFVTVTNNSGGGQPVSLDNLRAVRAVCDRHGVPLFLDACRFAENAWFIREREAGQGDRDVADIVREMGSLADGMTMSAKKDGLANIGGWLAVRDGALAEQCRNLLILTEGFPTYGGLAGRDLEAIAQGLKEVVEEDYLRYRITSTAYLGEALHAAGVPVVRPIGGHAVFLDARALLPHVPPLEYPGQSLAVALYREGGIRSCEIGTVMFGRRPDGSEQPAPMDLVRLAIPRRTYTQSHVDYVIEVVRWVAERAENLGGMRVVSEPAQLRHFTASFAPL
jgi:tryptophanase